MFDKKENLAVDAQNYLQTVIQIMSMMQFDRKSDVAEHSIKFYEITDRKVSSNEFQL